MDAFVHLTGNVGGDVEYRSNVPVASFRLACTPRVRKNGEWVDGQTTWLTVTCFRALADNVASSLRRGEPVLVSGRLRTNVWEKDGVEHERTVLEATAIGHDLTWGTAAFKKTPRLSEPQPDRQSDVGELISSVESQPGEPDDDTEQTSAA